MVKKSLYKVLLKIAIIALASIFLMVIILRGSGYWKSDFDRKIDNSSELMSK